MSKIEINNVYKIFGNNPKSVLSMVKDGGTKEEILDKTTKSIEKFIENVEINKEKNKTVQIVTGPNKKIIHASIPTNIDTETIILFSILSPSQPIKTLVKIALAEIKAIVIPPNSSSKFFQTNIGTKWISTPACALIRKAIAQAKSQ